MIERVISREQGPSGNHRVVPHTVFDQIDHRPWPPPNRAWSWRQSWHDLLFAHWPVSTDTLRPLVPAELEIQEFDGTSWVSVVPFRMTGVTRRPLPAIVGMSAFPEINLRLYVERDGKPGIWFLSLDTTNPLAVWAARRFFHLPYFRARISLSGLPGEVRYDSVRLHSPRGLRFAATYQPNGGTYHAEENSLEHWLTERYCLYARTRTGRLLRAEVHHHPWPLQPADVQVECNQLADPHGFSLGGQPSLTHFSRHIDVVVWSPEYLAE